MSVLLRFGGITMRHNPKTLKISRKKKISSVGLVGGLNKLDNVRDDVSKISGTAELYGDDCFVTYDKLLRMCFKNQAAVLAVPGLGAFEAAPEEIGVLAESRDKFLSVSFVFRAVGEGREAAKITSEQFIKPGRRDNLWDISYRYSVPIERLVELNPDIRKIMSLDVNKEVRLY